MTDDRERIATLEANIKSQKEDIDKLESNQKFVVITMIGLMLKQAFEYFGGKI